MSLLMKKVLQKQNLKAYPQQFVSKNIFIKIDITNCVAKDLIRKSISGNEILLWILDCEIAKIYNDFLGSTYILQKNQTNDCKYWIDFKTQSKAIWYFDNFWRIGYTIDIGTEQCRFKSSATKDQLPFDLWKQWQYWEPITKMWLWAYDKVNVSQSTFWYFKGN